MIEHLNSDIAQDILYGNSPRDMVNRAFDNKKLMELFESLRIRIKAFEYIERHFNEFINQNQSENYYTVGIYTSFVTLLYLLDKERTLSLIQTLNIGLVSDNFIHQINVQFLNFKK